MEQCMNEIVTFKDKLPLISKVLNGNAVLIPTCEKPP